MPEWQPRDRADGSSAAPTASVDDVEDTSEPAPTGSQRALGRLRRVADGVAAERRGYVRLATAIPALGVPEGAVVAAFERVDLVEADPMAEIVVAGVDPDRSLADHAFARRLHRRADTLVSIGPGPLVVAPDLASGHAGGRVATRSGRALALQLLGVALARADGLAADRIVVGAYPAWLADEPSGDARASSARSPSAARLFADHLLRFDEPAGDGSPSRAAGVAWPFMAAAGARPDRRRGPSSCAIAGPDRRAALAAEGRAAARVAAELAAVAPPAPLTGSRPSTRAAGRGRGRCRDAGASWPIVGWRALVGDAPRGDDAAAVAGPSAATRSPSGPRPFDPLAALEQG